MFRLARDAPHLDVVEVTRQALADPDTVVRLDAVSAARRSSSDDALIPLLPLMIGDPYPRVRREVVALVAERDIDGAIPVLRLALRDRNVIVREVARFFLRRRAAMTDFAAFYRDRLSENLPPRDRAAVLAGLGETGTASDAPLVVPFLEDERPMIRRAAARALADLDIEPYLARLAGMLLDDAPAVSHAVRRILQPRASAVGGALLTRIVRRAPHPHSRLNAVAVGRSLGKWDSLPILVEAAADGDQRIHGLARRWIDAWVARQNLNFAQPTLAQIATIANALDAHDRAIDPRVERELRSVLRSWAALVRGRPDPP
jgi:HEAT repeat protein